MITLDTSGILALLGTRSQYHEAVRQVVTDDGGPFLIAVGALAEILFMVERDFPSALADAFLLDLIEGRYQVHWDGSDLVRIRSLTIRYADLPLGFADAAVAVCAERHGGRVLTLDRRHFEVIARGEKSLTVLP